MKNTNFELALKLRKKGFSIQEISEKLKKAQSTVSLWVRNVKLSRAAKRRLAKRGVLGRAKGVRANRKKREALVKSIDRKIGYEFAHLKFNKSLVRIMCSLMHWCEGSKKYSAVGFTNSDPMLMSAFVNLLRLGFKINEKKFSVCLHLHEYHNENKQKKYWSGLLRIPKKQFTRVYIKPHTGKNKRVGYPGCVSLRYFDYKVELELKRLWEKIGKKYGRVG